MPGSQEPGRSSTHLATPDTSRSSSRRTPDTDNTVRRRRPIPRIAMVIPNGSADDAEGRVDTDRLPKSAPPQEGTRIAPRVRHGPCITAFTQPSNHQGTANGRFMENGCFEPRGGR
ncbi:hypothetical protein GCM10010388_63280 [Streptomyces mauvecolor]